MIIFKKFVKISVNQLKSLLLQLVFDGLRVNVKIRVFLLMIIILIKLFLIIFLQKWITIILTKKKLLMVMAI